jgi:hypothetical protein
MILIINYELNKKVFSFSLNVSVEGAFLMYSGRSFNNIGAHIENARQP